MSNTIYRYTGPNSAITLMTSDGTNGLKSQDVLLWHDQNVELPADHEVTQTWLSQGLLEPVNDKSVTTAH